MKMSSFLVQCPGRSTGVFNNLVDIYNIPEGQQLFSQPLSVPSGKQLYSDNIWNSLSCKYQPRSMFLDFIGHTITGISKLTNRCAHNGKYVDKNNHKKFWQQLILRIGTHWSLDFLPRVHTLVCPWSQQMKSLTRLCCCCCCFLQLIPCMPIYPSSNHPFHL